MGSESPDEGARHEDPHTHHSRNRHRHKAYKPAKSPRSKSDSPTERQHDQLDGQSSESSCPRLAVEPEAVDMFNMTFKVWK